MSLMCVFKVLINFYFFVIFSYETLKFHLGGLIFEKLKLFCFGFLINPLQVLHLKSLNTKSKLKIHCHFRGTKIQHDFVIFTGI